MQNPIIDRPRLGVSMCLLGENVRFDGGHKRERFLTDVLGGHVDWVPVCPELEVGMGVPRESVRLVGSPARPRMVGLRSGEDWTARMEEYAARKAAELSPMDLDGFIFKSNSPSCGVTRVRVYAGQGAPARSGTGLFASAFLQALPLVPVEEEGRLNDARIRENFIVRVFSHHRLRGLFRNPSRRALVDFHTVHKYLMLAHSPKHYVELGRLVARQASVSPGALRQKYGALFMEGLALMSTPKKNTNVLHHILGFLRGSLGPEEREEILGLIEEYRKEQLPLVVPLTLIRHYVKKYRVQYIGEQVYLNPHPKELMLRNHV